MGTSAQKRREQRAKRLSAPEKRIKQTPGRSKKQKNSAAPSRRWVWGGVVLALALVVLGIILFQRFQSGDISGIVTYSNLSRDHKEGPLSYPQTPPVGGAHSATWQNCGIYSASVHNENAVHSLEHGAVWITYQPNLSQQAVQQLQDVVRGHDHALLSPYPGLPSPIVATAWGIQLQVKDAGDTRLTQFLSKYEKGSQTPEPGAACSGGTGVPDVQ